MVLHICTYPSIILNVEIGSSANEAAHCVLMASFSCHVQRGFLMQKKSNHSAYVGGSKAMLTFGKGLIVTYTEGDMNRNPSCIIKHAYPILVTNVDFSSFLNKAVHCVLVASFSCQMQWSPLMERQNSVNWSYTFTCVCR